ncbi:MAG: methylmalonyl-CoA mutase [Polyangiaceae bacterium]|jgi:methylmalonyl-CoA mutase|nr:methylmalonyl-CoA mutase [Polyangiaceae bacterium]
MSTDERSRYRARVEAETGKSPEQLASATPAGVTRKLTYDSADLEGISHLDALPGQFPYVRGLRASMYGGRPWTIRQYAGFSTAEESNAFYKQALAGGQKGLSVAFDLPTHRGYDSDDERARGDVGKAGVAIDTVEDVRRLFEGIPLGDVSVSMTMNGAVLPVLAGYLVAAEEQGVSARQLSGTIQNDILKEFLVRNTYIYPPEPSLRMTSDVIQYASAELPKFNPISISGYHLHEAGATAALELGLTLADALEYVRAVAERGLDIDRFAPRLSFFFAIGMDFFTEIAKLRAARLLWASLLRERYAPKDPRSLELRTHCQTSGISLSAQDPLNNVVRTAFEALSAVLGGTQSLHTNAFDEALALPSDASARVARATQLILQHETGVPGVVDPLAGSYFVERLTHDLAEQARAVLAQVEAAGGMVRAIESGLAQRLIETAAAERQARVDRGQDVLVGVNRFQAEEEPPSVALRRIDSGRVRELQTARLAEVKRGRSQKDVERALAELSEAARRGLNLVPPSVTAMRARATVGEVSEALSAVFGRHAAMSHAVRGVYGKQFETDEAWQQLRLRTASLAARFGRQPRILVAKLGQDGHDRGAKIIASGLSDLGFDVDLGPLFQTPAEVARRAVDGDVHLLGISSQAGAHDELLPALLEELRALGAEDVQVVLGGIVPAEDRERLRDLGVKAVFGPGSALPDMAAELLGLLEAGAARGGV